MSNLLTRSLSGSIFVLIVIGAFLGGFWYLTGLFFVFSMIGSLEYVRISGLRPQGAWFVFSSMIVYLISVGMAAGELKPEMLWVVALLIVVSAAIEVVSTKEAVLKTTALFTMGLLYVPVGFSLLVWMSIQFGVYDWRLPLGMMILIWTNDTGAYLVGSSIGKKKLMPKVSPGKTVEGFIGGVLIALGMSFLIHYFWMDVSQSTWCIIALVAGVIGTLGDLFESKMKRASGVKDSGRMIPGHGGALDRFDALLFVTPVVYAVLQLTA